MSHLVMAAAYQPGDIFSNCPGYLIYRSKDGINWKRQEFYLSEDQYTHRGLALTEFTDVWLGGKKGLCQTLVTGGGGNQIFTYISFDDGDTWTRSPNAILGVAGWQTQTGISSVYWNNRLYLAIVGLFRWTQNAGIYLTSSADPTKPEGWPDPTQLISTDWKTEFEVALAVFNGKIYAGMVGLDRNIYVSSSSSPDVGSSWPWPNAQVISGNWQTGQNVSLAAFKGKLYMAMIGLDSQVYVTSSSTPDAGASWSWPQNSIANICPLPGTVSLASFEESFLCLAVVDENQKAIYTRVSSDGVTWTGSSAPIASPPVFPVLSPTAISISSIN